MAADPEIGAAYLADAKGCFRGYKALGERAFAQLRPGDWFSLIDPESNSIATIVKHMSGNMRSRWTGFLTSDGEKPDRNRDQEFILSSETTPEQVRTWWDSGWACVFQAMEELTPENLLRTVSIRGEKYTVLFAINRQIQHYAYHVGQIVFLAKHFLGAEWKSLSIPKGQSNTAGVRAEAAYRERHGI